MFKLRKECVELFALCTAYLIILFNYSDLLFGNHISFQDTDSFMRVVRIREFFQHHDLNNYIIARSNYPFGCELHWTRIYDFFLIGISWLFDLVVNDINKSIDYACFIISPLVGIVNLIFIYKIFIKIVEKNNIFLATFLFAAAPYLLPIFSFGHPDHHSFILLCINFYIYCTLKMLLNKTKETHYTILTAVSAAICVWASPETLIVLLLTDAVLFLAYMHDYKEVENLFFKTLITTCIVGTIATFPLKTLSTNHCLTLCLLLLMIQYIAIKQDTITKDSIFRSWHFVCLMMILLFIPNIKPAEYDKISIIHTTLFLCLSVFFAVNLQFVNQRNQLKNTILWAVVITLIFLSLFPRFLMGMSADIPPFVKEIWLNNIVELQSPFKGEMFGSFSIYSIIVISAIAVKIKEIKSQDLTKQNIIWIIFLTLAFVYWILACCAHRMIPYSVLFSVPLVVNLGMSSKFTKNCFRLSRILITVCLFYIPPFAPAIFSSITSPESETYTPYKQCTEEEVFSFLDNLSKEPVNIMAHTNHGPKILYYTKHKVFGSPYHRQDQGIVYSYIVTVMDKNVKLVEKVLKKTKTQYIFLDNKLENKYPNSYASTVLINGKLPTWITPVEMPKRFESNYSIFKVDQEALENKLNHENEKITNQPSKIEDQPLSKG